MRFFIIAFLIPCSVFAQVNLCVDEKGRKTYTEAECSELGMKAVGVITDIKPKSKRCYDLEAEITSQHEQAGKLRATRANFNMGEAMSIIVDGQARRLEEQYKKECKR